MSTTLIRTDAHAELGAAAVEERLCVCDCRNIHPSTDVCSLIADQPGGCCPGCAQVDTLDCAPLIGDADEEPRRPQARQTPAYAVIGGMVLAEVAAGLLGYGIATASQALIYAGATTFLTVVLLIIVDITCHQPRPSEDSR